MTSTEVPTRATSTRQIQQVYIKATPRAIWDAITRPEWTERYGYGGRSEYDMRPGGAFRSIASAQMQAQGMPEIVVEGEVIECDPPRLLVQTWRAGWDTEPATTLTYEIADRGNGVSCLTVTHDLAGAPNTAAMVSGSVEGAGGGWAEVLSDLKTLLETGSSMFGGDARYTG
jgi:uncharacterized protein YndB with AHSA1/START domain